MISNKLNNLFVYIEFLYSNIQNFNQYNEVINTVELMCNERNQLNEDGNYLDRIKYNELQRLIDDGCNIIEVNITIPIKNKAAELHIYTLGNQHQYIWNGIETDIDEVKLSFDTEHFKAILKSKSQYLEFRTNTHAAYLSLGLFFNELDRLVNRLFSYFSDTEHDVLETLKPKSFIVTELITNSFIQDKAETNEHESEDETNVFCKYMPLNIPIEHFKVFERNSKNGKPYLATEQLNMFIDKAFKGKKNIEKLTLNHGDKEKYFIVKRFYQFYSLAAGGFENTTQCKEKYIRLLTDNFTNFTYENVRHNFSNKVKRDW